MEQTSLKEYADMMCKLLSVLGFLITSDKRQNLNVLTFNDGKDMM